MGSKKCLMLVLGIYSEKNSDFNSPNSKKCISAKKNLRAYKKVPF